MFRMDRFALRTMAVLGGLAVISLNPTVSPWVTTSLLVPAGLLIWRDRNR